MPLYGVHNAIHGQLAQAICDLLIRDTVASGYVVLTHKQRIQCRRERTKHAGRRGERSGRRLNYHDFNPTLLAASHSFPELPTPVRSECSWC